MTRCAKTICKTYIGVVYERYKQKPNDSGIVQGLMGLLTGYDDNGKSICYTHIDSVLKYKEL